MKRGVRAWFAASEIYVVVAPEVSVVFGVVPSFLAKRGT